MQVLRKTSGLGMRQTQRLIHLMSNPTLLLSTRKERPHLATKMTGVAFMTQTKYFVVNSTVTKF